MRLAITLLACAVAASAVIARAEVPQIEPPALAHWHADSLAGRTPRGSVEPAWAMRESVTPAPAPRASTGLDALEWHEIVPPGPTPRQPAVVVADPAQPRLVVVGGSGPDAYFDEVWSLALDGSGKWTRLDALGPRPVGRAAATGAWDKATARALIFGGVGGGQVLRNDVWALTLGNPPAWSELTPATGGPTPRWGAAAVVDPVGRQLLIYGGEDAAGKCGDVWALSLDGPPAWTRLAAAASPPPRAVASVALDPVRDRLVVFGGVGVVNEFLSDTQAFDLATHTWTPLTWAGTAPGVMDGASLTWDPLRDRLVLFGGNTGLYGVTHRLNGLWELDLAAETPWASLSATGTPPSPRFVMGTAYDDENDRVLYFGGVGDAALSDTWSLTLEATPVWSLTSPATNWPRASGGSVAVLDARRDRMLVLTSPDQPLLALSLSTQVWSALEPIGERPSSRWGFAAFLDPDSDRVVMFGGYAQLVGGTSEVWVLPLSGPLEWRRLDPGGAAPRGRDNAAAVWDPLRRRMFVYGGDYDYDNWTSRNDTWMLNLTGPPAWTQVAVGASPDEGRSLMVAAYDPFGDRMVVSGGRGESVFATIAPWTLSFASPDAWQLPILSGIAPSPRSSVNAAIDPARDRVLMWSGFLYAALSPELWALNLNEGSWEQLAASGGTPRPRGAGATIWDPLRRRMLVWSGAGSGELYAELWELRENIPTAATVSLAAADAEGGSARLRWWWIGDPALVRIERREISGGWTERERRTAVSGEIAYDDRDVRAGARYEYRLRWSDPDGDHEGGLALVDVPATAEFALMGVTPNPTAGPMRVAFSLARTGEARITLRDVAGRRVLERALGSLPPGRQSVSLDEAETLPAGLYWITLQQGARMATTRCAVVR